MTAADATRRSVPAESRQVQCARSEAVGAADCRDSRTPFAIRAAFPGFPSNEGRA